MNDLKIWLSSCHAQGKLKFNFFILLIIKDELNKKIFCKFILCFSSYKSAYSKLSDKPKFINTGSPILPQTKPSGRYIIYN